MGTVPNKTKTCDSDQTFPGETITCMFRNKLREKGYKRERIRRKVQSTSRDRTKASRPVKKLLPVLRRIRKISDKARRGYVKKCDRVYRLRERVCQRRYKRQRPDDRASQSKLLSKKKGRQSSGNQEDVCVCKSFTFLRIIWMSVTRNCFPVNRNAVFDFGVWTRKTSILSCDDA